MEPDPRIWAGESRVGLELGQGQGGQSGRREATSVNAREKEKEKEKGKEKARALEPAGRLIDAGLAWKRHLGALAAA
jgi:hypothetical protein